MRRDIILIILFSSALLLFNLGSGSLSSWDEAYYAQISKEMVENSNWVDLTWRGSSWSDKPPLYMWMTAVFYKIFGINEFSARLFSCLSGIMLIPVIYFLALEIFSSRKIARIASVMSLGVYHYVWFARMGTLDITFTLFAALSLYFFLKSEKAPRLILWSGACLALSFLTKGVGAFIVPVILFLYVLTCSTFQKKILSFKYSILAALIFFLIVSVWYYPAFTHYGKDFLRGHFLQHLVGRTTGALDGHAGTWLSYINVILYKGKVWGSAGLVLLPVFIFYSIKRRESKNFVIIWWICATIFIYSLIKTKLHWYIIPVYPAVIIVAAYFAEKVLKRIAFPLVFALSVLSFIYFGGNKGVYALDFNPEIKDLSITIKKMNPEKVYLYGIGDPAMVFYMNSPETISRDDLLGLLSKKNSIVISEKTQEADITFLGDRVESMNGRFVAVKVK